MRDRQLVFLISNSSDEFVYRSKDGMSKGLSLKTHSERCSNKGHYAPENIKD